ncbi:hypothetical protein [Rhizobacter sp. P5_C2]
MTKDSFADRDGSVVVRGDLVRILAVPDLQGMREPYRQETQVVFEHIRGTVKRVKSVDDHGNGVLVFFIRAGTHAGYHAVAIEGRHVRKARSREAGRR